MSLVLINGKTAVHKGSQGKLKTIDICYKTSAKIKISYNNIAQSKDADQCAHTVFVHGNPACHKQSIFKKSKGDEAGDYKGIHSGTIKQKAEFISASSNVFIEGIAAVRNHEKMVSNKKNTPPANLQQPNGNPPQAAHNIAYSKLKTPKGPNKIGIEVTSNQAAMLFEQCLVEEENEQSKPISAKE